MAKKTKEKEKEPAASPDKVEQAEKAREAKKVRAERDTFKYAAEPESKLPPQAQGIVNILKEAGKKGLSRKDLVEAMEGTIETRQPIGRILTYYQKLLEESGAVVMSTQE